MSGFYYYNYSYFIFMLPALLVSMFAQFKLSSSFKRYSQRMTERGLTGEQAALRVLSHGGAAGVTLRQIGGNALENYYDPRSNSISLSRQVCASSSVASVGVAAHEAGHAIQYAQGYFPVRLKTALVPAVQLGSRLSMPLILIGLVLPVQYDAVVTAGIILYSVCVLFQFATLPVEFNASARALRALDETGCLTAVELQGAKKVLQAAAMTYLAGTFTALLSLLRLLLIASNRRNN